MFELISEDPFLTNDSFEFVSHEWISAVINIKNGACLTQVTADALFDGLELMEQTCPVSKRDLVLQGHNESHDFVPPSSELGQALMELHNQLESYNNQEWGPYENLLDELNESCDDDDDNCSKETGYLIWAIVVTVLLVLACIFIALMALLSMTIQAARRNRRRMNI